MAAAARLDRNAVGKPGTILFCPNDGHMLVFDEPGPTHAQGAEEATRDKYVWACPLPGCKYTFRDPKGFRIVVPLVTKQVEDVLGGEEAWANVAQTDATCPKCGHKKAFFREVQTRSADEPATIFYRCENHACANQWKEN